MLDSLGSELLVEPVTSLATPGVLDAPPDQPEGALVGVGHLAALLRGPMEVGGRELHPLSLHSLSEHWLPSRMSGLEPSLV